MVVEHSQFLSLFGAHVDLLAEDVGGLGCSLMVDVQVVVVQGIVALSAGTNPHRVSVHLSSLLFLTILHGGFCGFSRLSNLRFG
jgi:hypothetical protein